MNQPDQRYLSALCTGNSRLLDDIYRQYAREVMRWVQQNNGDTDDAKDLFQDALIAIYDRYCGHDFQMTGSFGGLVMAICRRKWFDRLAQKKREEGVRNSEVERYTDEAPEWEAAEEAMLEQKRQECLAQVFELLSEQCRKLLALVSAGETAVEHIAEQLGMAGANAVYQSKHRCIARWKQLFSEQFKPEGHE